MAKLSKDFFVNNEVLIIGYPLKRDPSMEMIMKQFMKSNVRIVALNATAAPDATAPGLEGSKIFTSLAQLQRTPKTAYIYLEKNEIDDWVAPIAKAGIQRVLFHSKNDVDPAQLEACAEAGLQTAVACPLMILGGGMHWFHGKLAGVR